MIKRLNNKGLTAIEVLVCFALVIVIVISMFNVVNNYKDKQTLESYKTSITTYKTTLTKVIYDDIIKNGGVKSVIANNETYENKLDITYSNDESAAIIVHTETKCIVNGVSNQKCSDVTVDEDGNEEEGIDHENSKYYVSFNASSGESEKFSLPSIYYLKFNEVYANESNGFIRIHVGLWHPDLGDEYDALNIITPNVNKYSGMLG